MKLSGFIVVAGLLFGAPQVWAQVGSNPRPQLYPNKHLSEVGETRANQDISECSNAGAGYVQNSQQPGQGGRKVVRGAARGALLGTVGGAVMGNTGRGAAAGALVGTTRSALDNRKHQGANNPAYQDYVKACLEDRGYKVLGWS